MEHDPARRERRSGAHSRLSRSVVSEVLEEVTAPFLGTRPSGPSRGAGAGAEIVAAAAGRTGQGGSRLRRAPPAPVPQRGPSWQAIGRPRGGGLGAYGRAGVLALAGGRRMKGHSCYSMCGAGVALGERTANTVRTDTRQDGQTLDGSQRPERIYMDITILPNITCNIG